jgi:hypothetical protein
MTAVVAIPRELWQGGELLAVDRLIHQAEDDGAPLVVVTEPDLYDEVHVRYQRLELRLNAASRTPAFHRLCARHRELHDTRKPLVRADWEHAVDTWQWVLRLEPEASAEVQLAALLHDVERLESEADARIEHLAPDYQGFKDAHARRGAELVRWLLSEGPWDVDRVVALVADHERAGDDPERTLLVDADVLSFFGLNCAGYLANFGPDATGKKVAWSLARASPRVRAWLGRMRLPPEITAQVAGDLGR